MPGDFFPGGSKPAGINILIVQAFTERRGSVIETLTLKEGELFPSDLGQAAGSQDPALSVRTVRAAEGGRRLADQPVHLQRCGGDHQCELCEREPDLQGVGGDGNPHPGARTLLHPGPGGAAAPGGAGLRVSLPPAPRISVTRRTAGRLSPETGEPAGGFFCRFCRRGPVNPEKTRRNPVLRGEKCSFACNIMQYHIS